MKTYKRYVAGLLPGLWLGLACGCITGAGIFFYKLAAKWLEHLSKDLYTAARGSVSGITAALAAAVLLGLVTAWLHRWAPQAKGGGIPRCEGTLRGTLPLPRLRTLLGTAVGSLLSFFGGLPVGSEGPAVLMGAALGGLVGKTVKNEAAWSRYAMTGGAGAGFAVATGAPMAAVLFTLEEIHKRFTPLLVLVASVSVVAASWVNRVLSALFGVEAALFRPVETADFRLSHLGYLLVLAVIVALAVAVFDRLLSWSDKLTEKWRGRPGAVAKLAVVFGASGVLGLWLPQGAYSGHDVIEELLSANETVVMLFLLLAVRMGMLLLVTDSRATGGLFVPTLALGALVGALTGKLLLALGLPADLYSTVIFLAMCGFMGGMLRAPLTAGMLFVELTGNATNLLYVALVIFVVNALTELFHQTACYDRTLEALEHEQRGGRSVCRGVVTMQVSAGSFAQGHTVRDILWPPSTFVSRVIPAEAPSPAQGEYALREGDVLEVQIKFTDREALLSQLRSIVGEDHELTVHILS